MSTASFGKAEEREKDALRVGYSYSAMKGTRQRGSRNGKRRRMNSRKPLRKISLEKG